MIYLCNETLDVGSLGFRSQCTDGTIELAVEVPIVAGTCLAVTQEFSEHTRMIP